MAKTRIYQCPECGELHPTQKDKGYIKCSCGHKGAISRHLVKTAQLTKAQQEELAGAKEGKAPATEKTPPQREKTTIAASQPGQRTSGRFQIRSQEKGEQVSDKKDRKEDQEEYGCAECKQPVKKGQKHCPHCGTALDWSSVD